MDERLVLAIEGSTRMCGAALLVHSAPAGATTAVGPGDAGWEVIARRSEKNGRGQARVLLAQVDDMLSEVGGGAGDLGAVVVGTGPGTFTGVRITVATGRALGLALTVPVLGVGSLSALAVTGARALECVAKGVVGSTAVDAADGPVVHESGAMQATTDMLGEVAGLGGPTPLLVPVVDARRGQVFFGVYEATDEHCGSLGEESGLARRWTRRGPFGVCDRGELGMILAGPAVVVAEEPELVGGLPAETVVVTADVQAEHLVLGQWLLEEPAGEAPAGWRLEAWLSRVVYGASAGAVSEGSVEVGPWAPDAVVRSGRPRPGDIGTPESVRPIYVRSPDADVHITKMRDPWAADRGRRDSVGGR
ncbi:MAG: tRNA (adenosine(37)-N6)-threonylcarbamoyltransferase complex dimerization subunit type 1 TsaB [Actinobacteria bacterium]|jgi:tRNA threonylcarbamoyl adenosine modification protein YeaZ|nr:tRNA (adenosine(37)-N6)-threonylcarbamoyltransferase complex dimerization subunit type 1 TsaB [Actinomycetota bacterium]